MNEVDFKLRPDNFRSQNNTPLNITLDCMNRCRWFTLCIQSIERYENKHYSD